MQLTERNGTPATNKIQFENSFMSAIHFRSQQYPIASVPLYKPHYFSNYSPLSKQNLSHSSHFSAKFMQNARLVLHIT